MSRFDVLIGGLMVAFSGLGVVLSEENDWAQLAIAAILCILLIRVVLLTPQFVDVTLSTLG